MKNFSTLILLCTITLLNAQKPEYNTKYGAIAEGYDVVTYFIDTPKKGNKKISLIYDNVKFLFLSIENLELFKKNPNKYIPQYGGFCAYAVAEKNKKMDIDPEVYEIRDGKLYLFYNPWFGSAIENWQEGDVKTRQKKGDKNWETLKYKN